VCVVIIADLFKADEQQDEKQFENWTEQSTPKYDFSHRGISKNETNQGPTSTSKVF
jgi:hypothetical protein